MTITVDYSTKTFKHMARTLRPKDLGHHGDGWTVTGEICEDYYNWVNYFTAIHDKYGKIEGNFEDSISAESVESLAHFLVHHPFDEWDYYDI